MSDLILEEEKDILIEFDLTRTDQNEQSFGNYQLHLYY